jgi:hypothetical protein
MRYNVVFIIIKSCCCHQRQRQQQARTILVWPYDLIISLETLALLSFVTSIIDISVGMGTAADALIYK